MGVHITTGDEEKFDYLEEYNGGFVRMGNDAPYMVRGKGSLMINDRLKCENAYLVKGLNYNLLSVAQLNNSGHRVSFESKKVKIFDDGGRLVGTGTQSRCNLFYLDNDQSSCLMIKDEDAWFWHKRLSHVNFDNMIKISKKKRVRGLPNLSKLDHVMCHEC